VIFASEGAGGDRSLILPCIRPWTTSGIGLLCSTEAYAHHRHRVAT